MPPSHPIPSDPRSAELEAALANGEHFRALYLANKRKFIIASVLMASFLLLAIVLLAVLLSVGMLRL
jgi:hypothetical protein